MNPPLAAFFETKNVSQATWRGDGLFNCQHFGVRRSHDDARRHLRDRAVVNGLHVLFRSLLALCGVVTVAIAELLQVADKLDGAERGAEGRLGFFIYLVQCAHGVDQGGAQSAGLRALTLIAGPAREARFSRRSSVVKK